MNREVAKNKICVALDVPERARAEAVINQLRGEVGMFKVGLELFTAEGPLFVRALVERGVQIFLDLKFHDIPNTVAGACRSATRLGVSVFDVHAVGGPEMMKAGIQSASEYAEANNLRRPKIIAITVLTSMDDELFARTTGSNRTVSAQVVDLAKMAQDVGLDGVVASPREIELIRAACGSEFLIVTPGVRGSLDDVADQRRVMTPTDAVQSGADVLVIGRPINAAADPRTAARSIVEQLVAL